MPKQDNKFEVIDRDIINGCDKCIAVNECGGMDGECPFAETKQEEYKNGY